MFKRLEPFPHLSLEIEEKTCSKLIVKAVEHGVKSVQN